MRQRILVAMSGGVDSAVAAALLIERGFEVIGVTMKMHDRPMDDGTDDRHRGCCTLDAAGDARRAASYLGVPHYMVNFTGNFEDAIIANFTEEYLAGRTPNPCVRCNTYIKFGALLHRAEVLGAQFIATGHYAQVTRGESDERWILRQGRDKSKDQSYALYGLSQEQLGRIILPLGEMTKAQTRQHARRLGLHLAEKPDSQEICFIPENDYRKFLKQVVGDRFQSGPMLLDTGEKIGEHKGIPLYTIGQRSGLGIAWKEPLYVIALDRKENTVVVGPEISTYCGKFSVSDVNWVSIPRPLTSLSCQLRIRYKHEMASGSVTSTANGTANVVLEKPQRAVTPGQAAVFYSKERVLGGGVIGEVEPWKEGNR